MLHVRRSFAADALDGNAAVGGRDIEHVSGRQQAAHDVELDAGGHGERGDGVGFDDVGERHDDALAASLVCRKLGGVPLAIEFASALVPIFRMEVERQVSEHPNVKEAAAIGVKAGEGASSEDEIMIVCIADGDVPDMVELTEFMAERMPYFMVPRYIRFVDALPKTPTERVRKETLSKQADGAWDLERSGYKLKRS